MPDNFPPGVESAFMDCEPDQPPAFFDDEGFREPAEASHKIVLPTAADILNTNFPEPCWIVPDYIPSGLSILAARPKVGKSWLAMQVCHAVAAGGKIFDQQVTQGRALYLALEDTARRLQSRLLKQGWQQEESQYADFLNAEQFRRFIGPLNKGGTAKLGGLIEANDYRFVVIDTLSRAFIGVKDMNDSQEVTSALAPIHDLAGEKEIGILLIDHHNKGQSFNQDPIDNVMASTAKSAIADTIFGIYTEQGKTGATLKARGRDLEEIDKKLRFDKLSGSWQILGDSQEIEVTEKQEQILAALKNLGKSKASTIAGYLGENRGNTSTRLATMFTNGIILQELIDGVSYYSLKEK